jgi:ring-1,2-phenylacetyl-CoA epoxidase subunit PaaE
VSLVPYLSAEILDGYKSGRLDKEAISNEIKANLSLLKADAFFLCGPEEMIKDGIEVLALFGVPKEKVHYELFTTPVLMEQQFAVSTSDFEGESKVTVILDDEQVTFGLNSDGKTILDAVNKEGYDAPYSCRGGVCSTCKAKVLKGKATMTLNNSLTDQEVQDGFILTCQAHPASEELTVSYDE